VHLVGFITKKCITSLHKLPDDDTPVPKHAAA